MCVYGRYAPDIKYYIGEVRTGQRGKAFALTTTTVQLLHFTHTFSRVETIKRDRVGVDLENCSGKSVSETKFLCHLP